MILALASRLSGRRYVDQSCPWVGFTHGLGWVGNVSEIFVFGGLDWVMGLKWQTCENTSRICKFVSSIDSQIHVAVRCIILIPSLSLFDVRGIWIRLYMSWVGYWVHKFTWHWVGLGWSIIWWVGLGFVDVIYP